jgi:iron transport multicopper oxidase
LNSCCSKDFRRLFIQTSMRYSYGLCAIVVLYLTPQSFAAIGPVGNLLVANGPIQPDGFLRDAVLGNGIFPGPLISGNKGDTFQIQVSNALTNESMLTDTSIHWHGLFQKTTNWADGASFVTQCPITPTRSFPYKFSVPEQAGTFWWHSHLSMQYCDGLRGPLVVYDPDDPHKALYDIDNEGTIITLADWHHLGGVGRDFTAPPDSTLINGKGRYTGGPQVPLAIVNVAYGKRFRFRLVSTSCDPNFVFSIDGHSLTVIEADSVSVEPVVVDSIRIFAGQRYSFVLNANNPIDNYWIRALPNRGDQGFDGGINSAILRYKGAKNADPTTQQTPSVLPLQEADLHMLNHPGVPGTPVAGGADVALNLRVSFGVNPGTYSINGVTFSAPSVPVLLQILSGARRANELLPKGSVYELPPNKVVELSLPGGAPGSPHPFHLHGHVFDVIRSAGSNQYNYQNPVRRDVVSIGGGLDNVTIRFVTDNSGPWMLHCHINHHFEGGMAIVFAEDTESTPLQNPVPDSWKNLCPTYNKVHKPRPNPRRHLEQRH